MSSSENNEKIDYIVVSFSDFKKAYDNKENDPDRILISDSGYYYFPAKYESGKLVDFAIDFDLDREYKYYSVDTHCPEIPESFEKYLAKTDRKGVDKWLNYLEIYDRFFGKYRGKPVKMLEIGIFKGGSLQMWKDYFGAEASIVGVDINRDCKAFEEPQIDIRIGSQEDRAFLKSVIEEFGPFDLILDDGGHTMNQQIVSFEELFPAVKDGGVYLCEDLHTSYWDGYGGGFKRPGTFIEFAKGLVDQIHGWHIDGGRTEYTRRIKAIHFFDSIVAFEKDVIHPPLRLWFMTE
jgi:hypothetical protein